MKNINDVQLSSVPLHCLDNENQPVSFGSGCIIEMPDCDYLFTVFHVAINKCGRWAIAREYIKGKGLEYVLLGQFTCQRIINIIKPEKTFDLEFAFTKIPFKKDYVYQEINPPNNISISKVRNKYKLQQIKLPDIKNIYGFSGHTDHIIVENFAITSKLMYHLDYKFLETREWLHVFKPPINHPGHIYYKGCSGAPIIDKNNNIVSLLICGDIERNEIYGVNLYKAITGFYIERENL